MSLSWIHESPARWDADKARVLGEAPKGVFSFTDKSAGELIGNDWWRIERDGKVIGYGWMDAVWGDAEVLLAVQADAQGAGVGTFVMDHLESEAATRGLNHLYNVIPPAHPEPQKLRSWLEKRGFAPSEDGKVLRRIVKKKS